MNSKKVIVCDLDGTLAASKSSLSPDMAEVLRHVLTRHYLAVVTGGSYVQFQKQFLSALHATPDLLRNLLLFPTMGSAGYIYDFPRKSWKQLYNEELSKEERDEIKKALHESISECGFDLTRAYGDVIEDRGSQITFSGQGQKAPLEVKSIWDPNQSKRRKIVDLLNKKINKYEIRIGGTTSIDITKKGIDKAFAIKKIKEILNVGDDDVIYIGDALYKGGNDESVKKTDVDFIQQSGPNETMELLSRYM